MVKHVSLCLTFVVASSAAVFAAESAPRARPAHHAPVHKLPVAPADEYFGHMKMSILGIRNQIKDLATKADSHPEIAESIFGAANLTEDAIKDWERKYPRDSWLPKTVFALERMYTKVPTDSGRERAKHAMAWLVGKYPRTSFAAIGRTEIAAGTVGAPVATAAVVVPATTAPIETTADTVEPAAPAAAPSYVSNDAAITAPVATEATQDALPAASSIDAYPTSPTDVPSYAVPASDAR